MRTNIQRSNDAHGALEAYMGHSVPVVRNDPEANDVAREHMSDLLTDLLHLMHYAGLDLDHEIEVARWNFDEEMSKEAGL